MLEELPARECDGDDRRAVLDAIDELDSGARGIIAMRLLLGWSFQEIGSGLAISEPAAKMRFQRALDTLRVELERRGVGP